MMERIKDFIITLENILVMERLQGIKKEYGDRVYYDPNLIRILWKQYSFIFDEDYFRIKLYWDKPVFDKFYNRVILLKEKENLNYNIYTCSTEIEVKNIPYSALEKIEKIITEIHII